MRPILLFVFVLVFGASIAATVSQDNRSKGSINEATAEQRGTQQAPLVVQVLPTAKSKEEADQEKEERHQKAELDRKLVDWTGDLANYTNGLAKLTGVLAFLAFLQLCMLPLTEN